MSHFKFANRKSAHLIQGDRQGDFSTPVRESMTRMRDFLDNCQKIDSTPDPRKTRAAHVTEVQKRVKQNWQAISVHNRFTQDFLTEQKKNKAQAVENKISSKAGDAQEIRSAFRGLSYDDRLRAINRALEANDESTLSAIATAPSGVCVGLVGPEFTEFQNRCYSAVAGEELSAMESAAVEELEFNKVVESVKELVESYDIDRETKRQIDKAEEAGNAFNNSMQKVKEEVEQ